MIGGMNNGFGNVGIQQPIHGIGGVAGRNRLREQILESINQKQNELGVYQRNKRFRVVWIKDFLEFDSEKKRNIAIVAMIVAIAAFVFTVSVAPKIFTPVYTAIFAGSLCLIHNFTASDSFREKSCRDEITKLTKNLVGVGKDYEEEQE